MRWNDQVLRDLRSCSLEDNWRTPSQVQSISRRKQISHLNDKKEAGEKHCNDEQK